MNLNSILLNCQLLSLITSKEWSVFWPNLDSSINYTTLRVFYFNPILKMPFYFSFLLKLMSFLTRIYQVKKKINIGKLTINRWLIVKLPYLFLKKEKKKKKRERSQSIVTCICYKRFDDFNWQIDFLNEIWLTFVNSAASKFSFCYWLTQIF